jgi:cytochrome P450
MRATRVGYCYRSVMGHLPFDMLDLHRRYGDIVRIAPNELAIAHPRAWKDIMGHRVSGGAEMEKYDKFYRPVKVAPVDIVSSNREEHSHLRKLMSHGFSDRSIQSQQPIIKKYVDLLIHRLHENCNNGKTDVDLTAWYNFTTFDIIGDLAFGEP